MILGVTLQRTVSSITQGRFKIKKWIVHQYARFAESWCEWKTARTGKKREGCDLQRGVSFFDRRSAICCQRWPGCRQDYRYWSVYTHYSVTRISSDGVSKTSRKPTSRGWAIAYSSITTSRRISSRQLLPLRRLRMTLAATVSPVPMSTHFRTTANFPLQQVNN